MTGKKQQGKRVYISLPITGRNPEAVMARSEKIKSRIRAIGATPVSPLDICHPDMEYNACMGKDIGELLGCDAIYLDEGWRSSKGCSPERAIARIYDIPVFSETLLFNK